MKISYSRPNNFTQAHCPFTIFSKLCTGRPNYTSSPPFMSDIVLLNWFLKETGIFSECTSAMRYEAEKELHGIFMNISVLPSNFFKSSLFSRMTPLTIGCDFFRIVTTGIDDHEDDLILDPLSRGRPCDEDDFCVLVLDQINLTLDTKFVGT